MLGRLIQPEIQEIIDRRDLRTLRDVLVDLSVQDAAEALAEFPEDERALAFRVLPRDRAADVFEHLGAAEQQALLDAFKDARAASILNEMDPDDRTELLEEVPDRVARRVMRLLSPDQKAITQALLAYPEDSVGRLMTPEYVKFKPHVTVGACLDLLRRIAEEKETISYVYLVDQQNVPTGVVSLKDLVFARPDTPVGELPGTGRGLVTIEARRDQEEAVQMLRHYDLVALPVVDRNGHMVGIVTVDDLMDVQEEEATEDFVLMSGVVPTDRGYLASGFGHLLKNRLLALVVLAITATFMGLVLRFYEGQLASSFQGLVNFIIVLMAASGNTGSQAGTLVIRAMATEEIGLRQGCQIAWRELSMGSLLGGSLGVVVALLGHQFLGVDVSEAAVVGGSLAAAVCCCNMVGTLLPMGLRAIGLDPAFFATPLITTISDFVALFVFFEIAKACLA